MCGASSRGTGFGWIAAWALLAFSSPALAQSQPSSPQALPSSVSSAILSESELQAKVSALLAGLSPELKPTLIAVLKESSARLKQGSEALVRQEELWTTAQAQLTALSKRIATERAVEEGERWKVGVGAFLAGGAVTLAFFALNR